jgi:hypothetical protein
MLQAINNDKREVTRLCNQSCEALWCEAAEVCGLTYVCAYKPNTRLSCRNIHEIGIAWKQSSGPDNCKRLAFIFDYFGTEVYRHALGTSHQDATTKHIMATMGIEMDVLPASMQSGQKTCVQQRYSYCSKTAKNNILRAGQNKHHMRVNLEQGTTRTKQNWKRPKEVFFISRGLKSSAIRYPKD